MIQNCKRRAYLMPNFMELDMLHEKIYRPKTDIWGLGPKNYSLIKQFGHKAFVWQRTYQAISQEPWLQFSQSGPHFLKNHEMNPIKL